MPKPFPHRYTVDLIWDGQTPGILKSPLLPNILGGPPPEFDGPGGLWSPEHLLVSAVSLCLLSTFQMIARKSNLGVKSYQANAEAVLDKGEQGFAFTAINVAVDLTVAEADVEKAGKLLQKAKEYCVVSNTLKTPVHLKANVKTA
jgi:organic hydroperoxide reductase OsmC/OhrA